MFSNHTFPRQQRLSSRKLIEQLFANGRSMEIPPFVVRYDFTELPAPVPCQFAVSVPKRNFKKAVQRNRIKRVVKEAYRLNKSKWLNGLQEQNLQCAVFLIYTGRQLIEFKEAEDKIILLLQRLLEDSKQEKARS